jgi:hypothetical protein
MKPLTTELVVELITFVSMTWVYVSIVIGLWKARRIKCRIPDGDPQIDKNREDIRRRATHGLIIIAATSLLDVLLLWWPNPLGHGATIGQKFLMFLYFCIWVPQWLIMCFLVVVRYWYRRPRQRPVVVTDPAA